MKMFDRVAIACDQGHLDVALSIRAALELFRLRVDFHFCVQKRNILDFLAGQIPRAEYVVLCAFGSDSRAPIEEISMGMDAVDLIEGKWTGVRVPLTPENIPTLVNLPGRTVINLGCNSGLEPFANAFLEAGCKAYVGPDGPVDQDAAALFAISFFYHLLSSERDPSLACGDEEAVQRAAALGTEMRTDKWNQCA